MFSRFRTRPTARTAAAGIVAFAAFGVAGCSDTAGEEEGTTVEDIQEADDESLEGEAAATPYEGAYDGTFYDDVNTYVGQEVTVSAEIDSIVSPQAFIIAGTADTTVDPMLVVGATEVTGLTEGAVVEVTGTVHEAFDLPQVEEDTGVDFQDDLFNDYDAEPYITATSVEVVEDGGGDAATDVETATDSPTSTPTAS
ncbi:hypothetical protein MO973_45810 [Paenibacillus sp. TRM 82003]|uniref:hypothetical protein n=1 Tax=Kineococcus sp. TRM81007 TaxID=2925831 RepID=UPI001F599FAC|nr:hypothetical protein [Kineococcus sp. TRM81007]MCI2240310.1 hypothetical protein [Kineococcus sp. TRM81007]MCI3927513.1 hypothetical protein [Paenibacillus sp. TRM 82003]